MTLVQELRGAERGNFTLEEKLIQELGSTLLLEFYPWTRSIDDALSLLKLVLPDTDEYRYSCTIWTGAVGSMTSPAARIIYLRRDEQAEGGWALGTLTGVISAKTPALAICAAVLTAREA